MGEAVVALEFGGVGLACFWLDMSDGGKTKPETLGLDTGTSTPGVTSLFSTDLWADCCLAALDWGLRCAEPLARP